MPEFSGSALVMQWIWSGGTVSLNADYRKCNISPGVDVIETTAGSDARKGKLPTVKDAKASIELVGQTGGTAMLAALAEGVTGTLIVGPEGTATNKPKTTMSAISMGVQQQYAYADVSILTNDFEGDGTTYTQGAY